MQEQIIREKQEVEKYKWQRKLKPDLFGEILDKLIEKHEGDKIKV